MATKQKTKLDSVRPNLKKLWRLKKYKAALDMLLQEMQAGTSRRLYVWISETYLYMKDYFKAEEFALKAKSFPYEDYYTDKEIARHLGDVYYKMGWMYFLDKKHQQAIEISKKAVEIDESVIGGYLLLGQIYYDMEEYEESIKHYNKGIKICPPLVAKMVLKKKELSKVDYLSHPAVIKKLKSKILFSDLYLHKSYSVIELNTPEEARALALEALKFLPEKDDPSEINEFLAFCNVDIDYYYYNKGRSCIKKEKYKEAKEILDKGLKSVNYPIGCHVMLSDMYDCLNDHEKSLDHANKARDNAALRSMVGIGVEKEDLSHMYALVSACRGNALKELKRYEEAKEAFHEALKHAPPDEDMGYVHEELEELKWR